MFEKLFKKKEVNMKEDPLELHFKEEFGPGEKPSDEGFIKPLGKVDEVPYTEADKKFDQKVEHLKGFIDTFPPAKKEDEIG